ncbi:MAG: protein kinase [Verrucomicrobiales bacterium]|nr:protein kinase [Verrucomicrobiales bacterium]
MSTPHSNAVCATCGLPLPGGEPTSRCPHCLLHLALADEEDGNPSAHSPTSPERTRARYFGDFELVEQIAQGGMGVVWKARQLTVHRTVALKMIHAGHLASAEARVRFAAEIEATVRLDHPHIVPLYETGEHDGVHFFTMKLLGGGDLIARQADFALSNADGSPAMGRELRERQIRIAGVILKIARAVHYAHRRGILHRDLKPSNVLLDDAGEPHVVDFGLAKMMTRESGFTFTQTVLGSPNYMAPEQAMGRTDELTVATDVYGLGAIFYHLLTGQPPFRADSPIATLRKVIDTPPSPPRKHHPAIDADLETICLKCLEKSATDRYATAEALAEDLVRWLEKRPILARRATAIEHAWRWCQRQPALATALVACLCLLTVVAVGSTIAALRIRGAEQAARAALRESQVSQARSLRLTSELGHREEGLRLLRNAMQSGGHQELRTRARDEWLATIVRTDLEFSPLPALPVARDPSLHRVAPGFDRVASLIDGKTVLIRDLSSSRPIHDFQLEDADGARLGPFSHDGRFLGIRTQDGLGVWDVSSGKCLWRTNGTRRVFAFAPDRAEFAVEEWGYQATILSLPDLNMVRAARGTAPQDAGSPRGWTGMALSPGGRTLVVARGRDRVMEWIDLTRDQVIRRTTNRAPVVAMAWSPDGTRFAAALGNGRVPVFAPNGRQVFDLPSMTGIARSLAFNNDASLLAVQGRDRVLRVVDTQAMRNAFDAKCDGDAIAFDPHGARLGPVFRGTDFGWFEMRRPAEFRQAAVTATRTELDGCRFSPDGRLIAVGNASDVVLCDPASMQRVASRPGWRFGGFAFDPSEPRVIATTPAGIQRWQIRQPATNSFDLHGMEWIRQGSGWRGLSFTEDGSHVMAINIHSNAAFVFDRTFTQTVATLRAPAAIDAVALGTDQQWAATASAADRLVRVWKVSSGEQVGALPCGSDPQVTFSGDGRWLAISGESFSLHAVGTWATGPPLPLPENRPLLGAVAFSPDSRLLAVVCDQTSIQLIDLESFQPLGLLQWPGNMVMNAVGFSPDGTLLAGTGTLGRLQIWDLKGLRHRLQELDLDWNWPSLMGRGFLPPSP